MIVFIIKSTFCISLIYLLYKLFLANEKMHSFKRFFLLIGILFSLIVSIVRIKVNVPVHTLKAPEAFSIHWTVFAAYIAVVLVLAIRFAMNISSILKLKRHNEVIKHSSNSLVITGKQALPFSFFKLVYVNKDDYESGAVTEEMLLHEFAHVKQLHSVDIVIAELMKVVFWFNPLVWLYKREMELNHEYEADNAVINSGVECSTFQELLISIVSKSRTPDLACNFTYSLTKKRLCMLANTNSVVRQAVKVSLIVPMVIVLGMLVSYSQKGMSAGLVNSITNTESAVISDMTFNSYILSAPYFSNSESDQCCDDYCE